MLLLPEELKGEKFFSPYGILVKYHCKNSMINQRSFFQKDALLFVIRGEKYLSTHHEQYKLYPNQCIFIPKGSYTFSNISSANSYQALLFFFQEDFLISQSYKNTVTHTLWETFSAHQNLKDFFYSLNFTLLTQQDFLSLKFQELLLLLSYFHPSHTVLFFQHILARQHTILNQLIFKNNLFESVEEMAQEAKLPLSTFSKRFKNEMGISPKEWIDLQRFLQAKKMLLLSNKSIAQIAIELNFGSCAWFIKRFKEKFGITPRHFRQNAKNQYF